MVEKVTDFSLLAMSKAIGSLLQTEALTSVAEFQSLVAHVTTARLLALYIDEILGNSTPLAGDYQAAVSQENHSYLTANTRISVRKYVLDQSTLGVFRGTHGKKFAAWVEEHARREHAGQA